MEDVSVSQDVDHAEWLRERLSGPIGSVTGTVPDGFEAYARVFHPVPADGGFVRWAEVASVTGRRAHPLMQWKAIATESWRGGDPEPGRLEPGSLARLLAVLAAGTRDTLCWWCVWDGWAWWNLVEPSRHGRVRLPLRSYVLFAGPIHSWPPNSWSRRSDGWLPIPSPNLFWPDDHSWCVATEVDFDSTLVAGTAELISTVFNDPELEAAPVQPADSLTADADLLNTKRN